MENVRNWRVYVQSFWVSVHHVFTHAPPIHTLKASTAPIASKTYQGGMRLRYCPAVFVRGSSSSSTSQAGGCCTTRCPSVTAAPRLLFGMFGFFFPWVGGCS